MFFDTYSFATLRVAEDLRQAAAERSIRPDARAAATSRASATTALASAGVAATTAIAVPARDRAVAAPTECGECRPSVAA